MGWYGTYRDNTYVERKKALLEEFDSPGWEVITYSVRGNEGYAAVKCPPDGKVIGWVILFEYTDGCLMLKTMSEHEGPMRYNAPKKVLDALDAPLDVTESCATSWRGRCRKRIAMRAMLKDIKDGTYIRFEDPLEFTKSKHYSLFQAVRVKRRKRSRILWQPLENPHELLCRIPRDTIARYGSIISEAEAKALT